MSAGGDLEGGGGGVGVVGRSSSHGGGGKAREGGGKARKSEARRGWDGCSETGVRLSASSPAIADEEVGESCWALLSLFVVPMGKWERKETEDGWSVVVFRPG